MSDKNKELNYVGVEFQVRLGKPLLGIIFPPNARVMQVGMGEIRGCKTKKTDFTGN